MRIDKTYKALLLLLGMWMALPTVALAQNRNCEETLREYVRLFEAGKYDQLIALVEGGESKMSQCDSKQKELLYEVISSAYLEIDKLEEGLDYIRRIFKNNHYYDAGSSTYSLEPFLTNLNKFKVKPVMAIGVNVGYDLPFFLVDNYYNIIDDKLLRTQSTKHKALPSFHAGVSLQYNLFKYLSLHTEANYLQTHYERTIFADNNIAEYFDGFRNSSITFDENLNQLNVPLYARFNLAVGKSKFVPAFYGGFFYRYTVTAKSNLNGQMNRFIGQDFSEVNESDFITTDASALGIDMRPMRNRHQYGPLAGIALTYQVRYFTVFADVRYMIDLPKFEKADTRYDNTLLVDYYYLDADSRFTNLSLSLGFTYNFIHQIKQQY